MGSGEWPPWRLLTAHIFCFVWETTLLLLDMLIVSVTYSCCYIDKQPCSVNAVLCFAHCTPALWCNILIVVTHLTDSHITVEWSCDDGLTGLGCAVGRLRLRRGRGSRVIATSRNVSNCALHSAYCTLSLLLCDEQFCILSETCIANSV